MIAFLISILGIMLFTTLLIYNQIGQASYCFLMAMVVLVSLAISSLPRLKELDFKNLRMTLRALNETKEELFAKERDLKKTALLMSQIMAFSSSAQGRYSSREGHNIQTEWYANKLHKLVDTFNFNEKEKKEIYKFVEKYKKIDRLLEDRDRLKASDPDYEKTKMKLEQLSSEIQDMLQKDINKKY